MQPTNSDPFIHPTAAVDEGCSIGRGTRVWHFSHIMEGAVVGEDCNIGQNVVIAPGAVVGDRVKIQNNVSVYSGVTVGDDAFLGPSCVFTNVLVPRSFISRKHEFVPTKVGKGASIGANATIVCGHSIGDYAMVGAGAVVTKDVPPYSLWTGNPARQTGWVSKAGFKLTFEGDLAVCPVSNECYVLKDGQVHEVMPGGEGGG